MMRLRPKPHVNKDERSALAFRTKRGHIGNEKPHASAKPSKAANGIVNVRTFIQAMSLRNLQLSRPRKLKAGVCQRHARTPTRIGRSAPYLFASYERSRSHDP